MASDEGKWGLVSTLLIAAGMSIYHVGVKILSTRKGRKLAKIGLGLDSSTDEMDPVKKDTSNEKLTDALLQFVHRMEQDSQADRQDRTRQWERIENAVKEIRDQAEATREVIRTMQDMGNYFQKASEQHFAHIDRVLDNQINLSTWLRENRFNPPSQAPAGPVTHYRPPRNPRG